MKSGALPLILCGDSVAVMAAIAGARRYYRMASLIYLSHEADLQVPATTPDGSIDGRVICRSHRSWCSRKLTRFGRAPASCAEPDVTLFGYDRRIPPKSSICRDRRAQLFGDAIAGMGGAAAARAAVQRTRRGQA